MIVFVSSVQINESCLIQLQLTSLAITVCSPFLIRKIFLGIYQCCHADHATSSRDCFYGDTKVCKLQQTSQLRSRYIPTVVSSTRLHAPTSRAISQDSGLTVTRAASAKVTNAISREKPEEWLVRS